MMRLRNLLILVLVCLLLTGCAGEPAPTEETAIYPTFEYTHYSSGGNAETYEAVILFEQSVSTFTSYQVAFVSCTCRDSLVNYYSVCYVELLNNKTQMKQLKHGAVGVAADFVAPKTTYKLKLSFRLRLFSIVRVGWHTLKWFISQKIKESKSSVNTAHKYNKKSHK